MTGVVRPARKAAYMCGPVSLAIAVLLVASPAGAQETGSLSNHVTPPPSPENREPVLLVHINLGAAVPIESSDICPGDSLCVLGSGGAFGLDIERRWSIGIGVSVGYDAWFVDSGGVFELGVVQIIRAAVRYAFAYDSIIHPTIHLGAGALVFGDTFLVSTVGGAVEAGAALELELTEVVSLSAGVRGWLFTTSPFTTIRDRTLRSDGLGLNGAFQIDLGLVVVVDRGGD